MIDVIKRFVESISREKGKVIGLDSLDLELMPESLSKELLAMVNLEEGKSEKEKPPLLLVALRS